MTTACDRINIEDSSSVIETKRVLVLEDSEMLQALIKRFLQSNSYEVVAVTNGVDGVNAVLKEEFDLIICDMVMPKLSGDMFYFAVKRTKPHLCSRFIFITGFAANRKIKDFMKEARGTMLTKPFQMAELLVAVTYAQSRHLPSLN